MRMGMRVKKRQLKAGAAGMGSISGIYIGTLP